MNICGNSSGFPLVSHPGFGLYTLSSGQRAGLGGVGVSAMAAHSQFATFSGRTSILFCLWMEKKRMYFMVESVID